METLCRLSYGGDGNAKREPTVARATPEIAPLAALKHDGPVTHWTAANLPDLTGTTVIVTGANSGLGLETSRELARAGASVLMAARNPQKAQAAVDQVRRTAKTPDLISTGTLDLASLASVREFASTVTSPIDILINNAGIMAIPRRLSADGFELQFATNHLGHFALTGLLLPHLLKAHSPRVTTVSSQAHRMGRMNFEDLMGEKKYNPWTAYGQSKLANLLFTSELSRRASGTNLTATAAHPGYSNTNLQAVGPQMKGSNSTLIDFANKVFGQSAAMGALPTLYAATANIPTDTYIGPDGFMEQRGYPKIVGRTSAARNAADAARLWTASEELTGVQYSFDS